MNFWKFLLPRLPVILALIFMGFAAQKINEEVITTTPPTTTVATLAPLGAFLPGWETAPTELAMQQTYVSACAEAYVMPHRLEMMYGNEPFVYIPSVHPIGDTISGALDDCWRAILAQVPAGTWVAPLAEANTLGEVYAASPEELGAAFSRLLSLDGGVHRICIGVVHNWWLSGTRHLDGVLDATNAAGHRISGICPSTYDGTGNVPVGRYVRQQARTGYPLLLAQTGTVRDDKAGWLLDLREELAGVVVNIQYFNHHQYAFTPGTEPWVR